MPASARRIRILHLEDDPRDAEMIHNALEAAEPTAEIVRADGRKSFEAALFDSAYDVILTDYAVPGYDGIAALNRAKELQPAVPVIVISGALGEEEAVRCLQEGATDYLLKHRLDRLGSAVRRALQGAEQRKRQQQAESALRESEERFRRMAETIDEVFWMADVAGQRILYISPACERVWGCSIESLMTNPRSFIDAVHPDDREQVLNVLAPQTEGKPYEHEYRIIQPSGAVRWIWNRGFPVRNPDGTITTYTGVATDITARKNLEVQLQRVQRVESVGLLASGIAHDMNNILAPIMMGAPLLRVGLSAEDVEKTISTIEASAQRGAALVRQLLIFGRGVEGERRPVCPAAVAAEVTKMIAQTFPKNISIDNRVTEDVWLVRGDATQLYQIMLNLCVNARDAMPDGGTLTLSAENVEIDAHYAASQPGAKPGKYVVMRVADIGMGIARESIDRIFDPFFTTKEVGKGTGLGLSTVLGITKSHGGFVRLQSELGEGSTFEIYIPASQGTKTKRPEIAPAKGMRGQGELVMVVDDEEHIRAVLRDMFVHYNYKVVTAQDGVEATAVFAANSDVKLVVTDLDMPLMDGINLGRVLRRLNPSIKIIISTGLGGRSGADRRQEELEALGVSAILTKPYTAEKLLKVVHTVLEDKDRSAAPTAG